MFRSVAYWQSAGSRAPYSPNSIATGEVGCTVKYCLVAALLRDFSDSIHRSPLDVG